MALSRREKLRNWLIREFSVISEDNGYRTTPHPVLGYIPWNHAVRGWPTICVRVGDEELEWIDDPRAYYDTICEVLIRGYFSDELSGVDENIYAADSAGEPLLHDMKRIFAEIVTKNLAESTNTWVISNSSTPKARAPTPFSVNQGYVELQFRVRMRVQDSTFE